MFNVRLGYWWNSGNRLRRPLDRTAPARAVGILRRDVRAHARHVRTALEHLGWRALREHGRLRADSAPPAGDRHRRCRGRPRLHVPGAVGPRTQGTPRLQGRDRLPERVRTRWPDAGWRQAIDSGAAAAGRRAPLLRRSRRAAARHLDDREDDQRARRARPSLSRSQRSARVHRRRTRRWRASSMATRTIPMRRGRGWCT